MLMNIKCLDTHPDIDRLADVKLTEMGNIFKVQFMTRSNHSQTIQMLKGGKQFMKLSTGEIMDCKKHDSRCQSYKNLSRTFSNIRDIINTNITDVENVRFVTLTYAENMTDTVRLYKDADKYHKRLKYQFEKSGYPHFEFISIAEPQGRGAWHLHELYIFDSKAPFIPNADIANIWGHGYTKTKKIDSVDNVGAYLTAYLTDLPLDECDEFDLFIANASDIKTIDDIDEVGNRIPKRVVKGARLKLYPPKFNILRHSRGIKTPESITMHKEDADEITKSMCLTFEKTFEIKDDETDFRTVINTKYYNKVRRYDR